MASAVVKQVNDPATNDLKVPLFPSDRNDFPNWKKKMMKYLRGKGLLSAILQKPKYITHTKKVSDAEYAAWVTECEERFMSADEVITSKKGKELVRNDDVLFKSEVTKHAQVVSILSQSFKQKQEDLIGDVFEDNAYETWNTIVSKYEIVQSGDNIADLIQQLHDINKLENEEITVYLARVDRILSTLKTLKSDVSDQMKRFYTLQGLKSDQMWKQIVDLIDQVDSEKKWTMQKLHEHLIAQENRMQSDKKRVRTVVTVSQQMAAVSVDTDVAAIGVSRDGVNGGYRGSRGRGGYNGYNGRGRGGRGRGRGGRGRGRGGYGNNYNNNNNNNNQQQQSNNNQTNSSNSSSSATSNNNNNNNNNINNNDINNNYDYHDKSDIQCYTCGKWGHYARSCWYSGKKARNESYSAIVDDQVQESQSHPLSSSSHGEIEHGVGNDDYYDDSGLSCMGAGVNVRDLKNTWILDSGATSHHTGNRQLLTEIRKLEEKYKTMTGDGGAVYDQVGVRVNRVCR